MRLPCTHLFLHSHPYSKPKGRSRQHQSKVPTKSAGKLIVLVLVHHHMQCLMLRSMLIILQWLLDIRCPGIHLEKSPRGGKSTSEAILGGGGGGGGGTRTVGSIQFRRVAIPKGRHKVFNDVCFGVYTSCK